MNTQSNVEPESPSSLNKPPAASASRAMYWSIRRELWENRSICFAPLAVAGVVLLGFSFSAIQLPQRRRAVLMLDEVHQRVAIQMPYDIAAAMRFESEMSLSSTSATQTRSMAPKAP